MSQGSAIKAWVSNRFARHLDSTPLVLSGSDPTASFTFDIAEECGKSARPCSRNTADAVQSISRAARGQRWHRPFAIAAMKSHAKRPRRRDDGGRNRAEPASFCRARLLDPTGEFRLSLRIGVNLAQGQLASAVRSSRGIFPAPTLAASTCNLARDAAGQRAARHRRDRARFRRGMEEAAGGPFPAMTVSASPSPSGCMPKLLRCT